MYNWILCSVDRAFLFNPVNETKLVHYLFLVYFVNFIYNLYMFRTSPGPSSGGTTVFIRHLVLVILYSWLSGMQYSILHTRQVGCGSCPVFALYPGFRLKTKEKPHKTLSQINRKVTTWTALGMILGVDLATVLQAASTGLLTLVTLSLRFRRLGPVLVQRKYLPSAEVRGSS